MKIFVLDDMQVRHNAYKKKFPTAEVVSLYDATSAIEHLLVNLNNYDLICLDHDLGNRIFVSIEDKNTGSAVAKFLSDKEIKCPIIIHSLNYWGAKNMLQHLPQAKYVPFYFNKGVEQCKN